MSYFSQLKKFPTKELPSVSTNCTEMYFFLQAIPDQYTKYTFVSKEQTRASKKADGTSLE